MTNENDGATVARGERFLTQEAKTDLLDFVKLQNWTAEDYAEMVATAQAVYAYVVSDIDLAIGWAITLQYVRITSRDDGISYNVIFERTMLQETTAMFNRGAWRAAEYLKGRREGDTLSWIIGWLLYILGLRSRKPRTVHSYRKPIASYAKRYIQYQNQKGK